LLVFGSTSCRSHFFPPLSPFVFRNRLLLRFGECSHMFFVLSSQNLLATENCDSVAKFFYRYLIHVVSSAPWLTIKI
jgi:hypothetical protein